MENKIKRGKLGTTIEIPGNPIYFKKTLYNPILVPPYPTYFTDEIQDLKSLVHPCLLIPHDIEYSQESGCSFITLKMANGSVSDYVNGAIPEFWTITNKVIILIAVAHSLSYLHRNGIIHGNLHSRNVLIDERWMTRLTDFGINHFVKESPAAMEADLARANAYMSPELIKGDQFDNSIDIFAYGSLMYEIINDKLPFRHENPYKITVLNSYGTISTVPMIKEGIIPKPLESIMRQCWSLDPKKRPTFEKIISTILENIKDIPGITSDLVMNILNYFHSASKDILPKTLPPSFIFMKICSLGKNPRALFDYGMVFLECKSIPPNYEKASYYIKMSSDLGYLPASEKYASLLEQGKYVQKDINAAYDLFALASTDSALLYSKYKLGVYTQNGYGCVADHYQAFTIISDAAEKGQADAINHLGTMYEGGIGVAQDINKAKTYYKTSSEKECPEGCFNYGRLLEFEKSPNYTNIMAIYQKAADGDNVDALNRMGEIYRDGRFGPPNPMMALHCFVAASGRGHFRALFNMGLALFYGQGIEPNLEVAKDHIRQAIKAGNRDAFSFAQQNGIPID